jgi:hypothetical protein
MDSATILISVLAAVVVALLAWFEINFLQNDAKVESKSTPAQSGLESLKKKNQTEVESSNHWAWVWMRKRSRRFVTGDLNQARRMEFLLRCK